MRESTRYNTPPMWIIGKQYILAGESQMETIQAIIEATEKDIDGKTLHEVLFDACIDAFQAGRIDGIRSERARRRNKVEH